MTEHGRIPLSAMVLIAAFILAVFLLVLFMNIGSAQWATLVAAGVAVAAIGIAGVSLFWIVRRLEVSEARLTTIYDNASDGIIITDENGYIEKVNTSTIAIFGFRPGEMVGSRITMLFSSVYQEDDQVRFAAFLHKNGMDCLRDSYEVTGLRRDGRTFPMDFSANSAYLDERLVYIVIVRDVTERAESRIALEQARNELEMRVIERTGDLQRANEKLHAEINIRKRAQSEREKLIRELQEALVKIKTLKGLIPICASCKKIRDDKGFWNQIEVYIKEHSDAEFSHGICPECVERLYPELGKNADIS